MGATRILLNGTDWEMKGFIGLDWLSRRVHMLDNQDTRGWKQATVPGSVHYDLWQNGEIPDPYFGQNSLLMEWVPERTWVYRKTFRMNPVERDHRVFLHFEGIDYSAQLFLNGKDLGVHEGVFVPIHVDVTDELYYGEDNYLAIIIMPAPDEQPQVGRTSLVHTHKSRMTYWWDFCPRMIHVGVWDQVYLEVTGPLQLTDVWVNPTYDVKADRARIAVRAEVAGHVPHVAKVQVKMSYQGEVVWQSIESFSSSPQTRSIDLSTELSQPALWWPNGYGEPALYDVEVTLYAGSVQSDVRNVSIGIRDIQLIPNEGVDESARPYTFVVNGVKVYIKGWNWCPMDVLYGVERPNKLNHLLNLVKNANVNLLRVWGGGLIEKEAFYRWCDSHGIMVWQEWIQSSSGVENKPSDLPEFIDMMVDQAQRIVPRRRNHPSLVLWCGGNELQDLNGIPLSDDEPVLGALRDVVRTLDPTRQWLPTSPTGPRFMNSLDNIRECPEGLHDVHGPWEHQGLTAQYTLYNQGTSLFHSEFGVEGIANRRTIDRTIAKQDQWPANRDNPVFDHRGSWWINEPFVQACFGSIGDLRQLTFASQFLQAEGLRYALESNRRRAFRNSGSIPWQFNESYPNAFCTAAVDYFGVPKPAYYAVARAYRPIQISAKFASQVLAEYDRFEADVWLTNSTGSATEPCRVEVRVVGVDGHCYGSEAYDVLVDGRYVQQLRSLRMPMSEILADVFFLDLAVIANDSTTLATNRYVFSKTTTLAPLQALRDTTLAVQRVEDGLHAYCVRVENTGETAALMVVLDHQLPLGTDQFVRFQDNAFHLLPGETRVVGMDKDVGLDGLNIRVEAWNANALSVQLEPSLATAPRGGSYVSSR